MLIYRMKFKPVESQILSCRLLSTPYSKVLKSSILDDGQLRRKGKLVICNDAGLRTKILNLWYSTRT